MSKVFPSGDRYPRPERSGGFGLPEKLRPGQYQAVHIICNPERLSFLLDYYERLLDEYDEIVLTAQGESEEGQGYLVLQWDGCFIDRLFLRMLELDESVIDFVVYIGECLH